MKLNLYNAPRFRVRLSSGSINAPSYDHRIEKAQEAVKALESSMSRYHSSRTNATRCCGQCGHAGHDRRSCPTRRRV